MQQKDFNTKRDKKKLVTLRQYTRKVPDSTLHIRNDIDHAAAGIQQDPHRRLHLVLFFEDLNVLRLIVVVNAKVCFRKVTDEVAAVVFDSCKDIDQVDVDFKSLRVGNCAEQQ